MRPQQNYGLAAQQGCRSCAHVTMDVGRGFAASDWRRRFMSVRCQTRRVSTACLTVFSPLLFHLSVVRLNPSGNLYFSRWSMLEPMK